MLTDFNMIVHELERDLTHINVYPIGDVHIGADQFDQKAFEAWIKMVKDDPNGRVVIIGDMLDNALKNSKSNSYDAVIRPREQKTYLTNALYPIKDKILGAIAGNHEYRTTVLTDQCPMYDVMAKLDIEHLYRENMAFLKINLGEKRADRQYSYTFVLAHGASRTKVEKFGYSIDGMDVLITGHTHSPESNFPQKIVIDPRNNVINLVDYIHLVVPSFHTLGGYALKAMYLPKANKTPMIQISGVKKGTSVIWT